MSKCFVRAKAVKSLGVHRHLLLPGWKTECADRSKPTTPFQCVGATKNLARAKWRLNHYAVQSNSWFMNVKALRGDVKHVKHDGLRTAEYFRNYDKNVITDVALAQKKTVDGQVVSAIWSTNSQRVCGGPRTRVQCDKNPTFISKGLSVPAETASYLCRCHKP